MLAKDKDVAHPRYRANARIRFKPTLFERTVGARNDELFNFVEFEFGKLNGRICADGFVEFGLKCGQVPRILATMVSGWMKALALSLATRSNRMFAEASYWRARTETDVGILYLMKRRYGEALRSG
jgi:hypothetical protein